MVPSLGLIARKTGKLPYLLHLVGPLPDDTGHVGGVGLYHLRFIESLAARAPAEYELIVHSQRSEFSQQPNSSGNVRVHGSWQNGFSAVLDLWKLIFVKPGVFVFQYEVQLFGSVVVSLLLPALILLIRLRGSRVLILMHHVISPALTSESLKDWKTPSFIDGAALAILRANQRLISSAANGVIVHETIQARVLRSKHAFVVPHGVSVRLPERQAAAFPRRSLRIAIFGFIAPYKGSLEAAKAVSQLLSEGIDIELNIVGGEHPRMRTSPEYRSYIDNLRMLSEAHPEISMKGFVPASHLDTVLLENDVVVLPYKAAVGVSGALSYAIGLGLPIAVSDVLGTLMDLPIDIPRFDPSVTGIATFLRETVISRELPPSEPIHSLAMSRSWTEVARRVWDLIRSPL